MAKRTPLYIFHCFLPFDFLLVFRVVINLFPILFPAAISVLLPDSRHREQPLPEAHAFRNLPINPPTVEDDIGLGSDDSTQ